jgi:hypothetical protein
VRRPAVRLTLACNNACVFCAQRGVDSGAVDVRAALAAARSEADEVMLTGGEPTLDVAVLVDAIAAARELGFRRVGVQTNGAHLDDPRLTAAGLTDAHVSLHGATAAVHDYHTGVRGSFDRLLAGVRAVRARGVTVVATTVLTRSNFRVVGSLPWLLESRGIAGWNLAVPHAAGRAGEKLDRVVPRLGLALPFALHALQAARKLGLPAWITGAPLCALGPFAARALPGRERAYAEVCASCAVRPSCPGVDAAYLARFGGDELSARAEAPAVDDDHPSLRAMFTGTGELGARVDIAAVPESPGGARAKLPVIGRSKPAARETPRHGANKTGDELREIFPDLFDRVKE